MATWFIGAKTLKLVNEAEKVLKCWPIECDDWGMDKVIGFLRDHGRWDGALISAQPIEHIYMDGGGMVRVKEPQISWLANGARIKVSVRGLPFALEHLDSLRPSKTLEGCLEASGFCRHYVIAEKTRDDSVVQMRRLLKGTESLRQEVEIGLQKAVDASPHARSVRKCGCMSGKQYIECCGKYVSAK